MIWQKKEINPYPVTDKVTFRNLDETIMRTVRGDAGTLVAGLRKAHARLAELNDETEEKEKLETARYLAKVIFGEEQAEKLIEFYHDPLAVISACGLYFQGRLSKKITKAQKA